VNVIDGPEPTESALVPVEPADAEINQGLQDGSGELVAHRRLEEVEADALHPEALR
jgi:hypothetical protein